MRKNKITDLLSKSADTNGSLQRGINAGHTNHGQSSDSKTPLNTLRISLSDTKIALLAQDVLIKV